MPTIDRRAWLAMSGLVALANVARAQTSSRDVNSLSEKGSDPLPIEGRNPEKRGLTAFRTGSKSGGASRALIKERFFPNVILATHEGKEVRFYDDLIKDKVVTINFMYARCDGVCPGITENLLQVQKLLGKRVGRDIFMYSITLKPEEDTPEALKAYAQMYGVKPGWSFLTGKPGDIELLRRKLGFTDPDPEVDQDKSQHIGNIRYGNEARQLWAACPGLSKPEWIVKSLSWVDGRKVIQAQK